MRLILVVAVLIPAADAQEAELRPGLVGEYFYLGRPIIDFPEFAAGQKPRFKRVDREIHVERTTDPFPGTKLRDTFFVRWTGLLRVPRTGKYRFFTISDDGSRLFVDGKLVVSNGGKHEMKEEHGTAELAAGDRALRIDYFDNTGPAGLMLFWEGPGITKELLPREALFHRASAEPTEEELRGIDLPAEDARADAQRERKGDRPAPPPPEVDDPAPLDETIVPRGEKPPDVRGRVAAVFKDGATLLVTLRTASGEVPIFVPGGTSTTWIGVQKERERPEAGDRAYVWLKPGSKDTAARIIYAERK